MTLQCSYSIENKTPFTITESGIKIATIYYEVTEDAADGTEVVVAFSNGEMTEGAGSFDPIALKSVGDRVKLSNKYTVDYFQREYKWERKNIEELIDDLRTAFFDNYKEGDIPSESVSGYGTYFMGSVVINEKSHPFSIIDGQQRITSLTLLLMLTSCVRR